MTILSKLRKGALSILDHYESDRFFKNKEYAGKLKAQAKQLALDIWKQIVEMEKSGKVESVPELDLIGAKLASIALGKDEFARRGFIEKFNANPDRAKQARELSDFVTAAQRRKQAFYSEWIFDSGFSPGLLKGHAVSYLDAETQFESKPDDKLSAVKNTAGEVYLVGRGRNHFLKILPFDPANGHHATFDHDGHCGAYNNKQEEYVPHDFEERQPHIEQIEWQEWVYFTVLGLLAQKTRTKA